MRDCFFSIIIPVFNSEKTLVKAISSALDQVFDDFEILIIDGLSTDSTRLIVENFMLSEPRISWISEKDNGIYDAMNKGIKLAKGKWLYFLGSDDYLYNNEVLKVIYSYCLAREYDLLYGRVYSGKREALFGEKMTTEDILFENICHQAIFYNKDVFSKIGNYNELYRLFADWDFNIRCFLSESLRIKYVEVTVAYFADGGASSISKDDVFLRNNLFSKKIQILNVQNIKKIWNIKTYDKWWRFMRNLDFKDNVEAGNYISGAKIPAFVNRIILSQAGISRRLIRNGFVSKVLMSLNYFRNLWIGI